MFAIKKNGLLLAMSLVFTMTTSIIGSATAVIAPATGYGTVGLVLSIGGKLVGIFKDQFELAAKIAVVLQQF